MEAYKCINKLIPFSHLRLSLFNYFFFPNTQDFALAPLGKFLAKKKVSV